MTELIKCICGETITTLFDDKIPQNGNTNNVFQILKCTHCETLRTFPSPITDTSDQKEFYQDPDYFESARTDKDWWISLQKPILDEILKIKTSGKFLDIGTGIGFLTYAAKKLGFDASGIDYNESVVNEGKSYFPGLNISTTELSTLEKHTYDVIVINHVLEHIVDPISFINQLSEYLSKDGILVIGVPNLRGGIPRFLRFLNKFSPSLGKNWAWQGYQLEQHIWHFTPKTLKDLSEKSNLQLVSLNSKINMGYGLTEVKSFKYQFLKVIFKIVGKIHGGDHLQIALRK